MNIDDYAKYTSLLEDHFSISLPDSFMSQIELYHSLLSTWNISAKLLSNSDVQFRLWDHTLDSLTLLPYFPQNTDTGINFVDIGSGGGFPAIPISIALDDLPVTLVERNQKKATFLNHIVQRLGLKQVKIHDTSLDQISLPPAPRIVTSRAVEKPELISAEILSLLEPGDIYLCQLDSERVSIPDSYKSELIIDVFNESPFRRGKVYRITRSNI